ncbi:MAG TPA: rhodanese-like domain-containing protein [Longimicrobiales bacterium]|nr:rhodanese-like domain-containing protein [Longimicrobiales bacterium]
MKTMIVALGLVLSVVACEPGKDDADANPEQAPLYVDVRTTEEFASGHVQGALNIPVEQIEQRWNELEPYRDQQIIVYCRTGRRSARAIEVLQAHGFTNLENGGGFDALRAAGVPAAP